jgi:hypothetical protein
VELRKTSSLLCFPNYIPKQASEIGPLEAYAISGSGCTQNGGSLESFWSCWVLVVFFGMKSFIEIIIFEENFVL